MFRAIGNESLCEKHGENRGESRMDFEWIFGAEFSRKNAASKRLRKITRNPLETHLGDAQKIALKLQTSPADPLCKSFAPTDVFLVFGRPSWNRGTIERTIKVAWGRVLVCLRLEAADLLGAARVLSIVWLLLP